MNPDPLDLVRQVAPLVGRKKAKPKKKPCSCHATEAADALAAVAALLASPPPTPATDRQLAEKSLVDRMGAICRSYELGQGSRRVMLFPRGEFKHPEYGTMTFDDAFFAEIQANFDNGALGHTKPFIDVEHNHGAAAGWLKTLSQEPDGLFAEVDWTDLGTQLVSSGQYKHFSPWWGAYQDPGSGKKYNRVLRGGALTNVPFLKVLPAIELFEPGCPSPARTQAWASPYECRLSEMVPYPADRATAVRLAYMDAHQPIRHGQMLATASTWVTDVDLADQIIIAAVEEGVGLVRHYQIPYTVDGDQVRFSDDARREVRQAWVPLTPPPTPLDRVRQVLAHELAERRIPTPIPYRRN